MHEYLISLRTVYEPRPEWKLCATALQTR